MQGKGKKKQQKVESSDSENSDEQSEGELIVGDGGDFNAEGFVEGEFNRRDQEQTTKKRQDGNAIHLRFVQRTTRKCWTVVQGLPDDLDCNKINKAFRKAWCCGGKVKSDEEHGEIIQLMGDHRRNIMQFLLDEGIASKDQIKVHGY